MVKRPSRSRAKRSCLIVVLAAGEGTRMRSALPKVMHPVGGLPMLGHVLKTATAAGADALAVVIGPNAEAVRTFVAGAAPDASVYEQRERLGTAHAVQAAAAAIRPGFDDVLVLYGDTPLLTAATLKRLRRSLAAGADVTVLGFEPDDPGNYGRLIVKKGELTAIREARDASSEELKIRLCNAGIMAFAGAKLLPLLKKIGNANAKGEYYLTDAVELVRRAGGKVKAIAGAADGVIGVNDRRELSAVEALWQARARAAAMRDGATLIDPDSVHFSHDTRLGRDVVVEPNVFFAPGVTVADGAHIRAFSHLDGASIGRDATIGPFARLRPGAAVGAEARIGNFVEVKEAEIGVGAKVSHLTYIGDASVGANSNIGAGTITCNYDGVAKYRTEIGADVFIGSNSALIAPVTVGRGAYVATGSVITKDVPDGALAIGRARQEHKPGWAARLRAAAKKKPD